MKMAKSFIILSEYELNYKVSVKMIFFSHLELSTKTIVVFIVFCGLNIKNVYFVLVRVWINRVSIFTLTTQISFSDYDD